MSGKEAHKKAIAVILQGGLGHGYELQGIPVVNELLEGLAVNYDLYVYQLSESNEKFRPENYTLKAYPYKNTNRVLIVLWLFRIFFRDNLRKKFKLIHGIRAYPAGYLAVKLGKLFGIRSLVSFQGGDATYIPAIAFGAMKKYKEQTAFVCSEADDISVLTGFQEDELRKQLNLERSIHVIPYGIDPSLFYRREIKEPGSPLQLLHVADLNPVKDQDTLLLAFRLICEKKESRLTI